MGLVVEDGVGVGIRITVVLEGVELIELGDSIEVVMVDEDAIELGLGVEDALEVTTFKEEVDKVFEDAIMYSFGFNGYVDCIEGIIDNMEDNKIKFATFIKNKKKNVIKNNYYAALKNNSPIKNTIKLKKNITLRLKNGSGN